ncbi:MAG TPA: RodZ domain-containing protein [Candidatus Omnitrophota bacterium]|nr:RodZ domain-containing protein [Candidatus Omnitrophota bacterium]
MTPENAQAPVTIGNTLKDARLKKSITLEEVHARIKIHPRVLQLLEENKFDKLPSPLFAKSFLKSYAEFLEINPEQILENYEKQAKTEPEQVLYIKPAALRDQKPLLNKNAIALPLAALVVAGLVALAIFLVNLAGHWIADQKKNPAKPKAQTTQTTKAKAAAEPAPAKEAEKPRTSAEWLRSVEQGNFPKIAKKTPLDLSIRAIDSVWIRVTVDGKVLFQAILQKGQTEAWKAQDAFEIWTGNSSNMSLTLNRQSLGSPGKGVVKRMVINREGVKNSS